MACAQRVIVYVNEDWYREQLHDVPPVLNARTAQDVCDRLVECTETDHLDLRRHARAFIYRNFRYQSVAGRVLGVLLRTSKS
jgi:hypothetical protein